MRCSPVVFLHGPNAPNLVLGCWKDVPYQKIPSLAPRPSSLVPVKNKYFFPNDPLTIRISENLTMKRIYLLLMINWPLLLMAQSNLTGTVTDEAGKPLPYATVALMKPADSTLAFFGITNEKGFFDIRRISQGNYLMQTAFLGYETLYNPVSIPRQAGDFGVIVLKQKPLNLSSAEVVAEHIPVVVKNDTIEFNAGAFRTKPDAVAEDLLKKLPGVQVDQSGNIKAMGEDVKNVMVDGKEFFSSDPKVATKNLPADAISKVQVYDKKSETAELAGIDDSSREKTINLLLKDGRKQAWLGEVMAGGATGDHYTASAKVYRFTARNQFALLGMINNINQFGFSFQDYIDFNGGLPSLMGNGSMRISINSDSDIPVNFGQSINGLVTSGAGGVNYSFEPRKNNRFYISYLGNGSQRNLFQETTSRNYLSDGEYLGQSRNDEDSRNFSHRINLGWKDKSDSTRTMIFSGNAGVTDASEDAATLTQSFKDGFPVNSLASEASLLRNSLSGNGAFSYMQRGRGAFRLFSGNVSAGFRTGLSNSDRLNILSYAGDDSPVADLQFRDNESSNRQTALSGSSLISIGKGLYLEPMIKTEAVYESINRTQGLKSDIELVTDSLSPDFSRSVVKLTPGINLKKNFRKAKVVAGLSTVFASTRNKLNSLASPEITYQRLLPSFSWEYDYKTGQRVSLDYNTSVNDALITQLVPVVDNSNPQSLLYGNPLLKPETRHDLFANWLMFDQFSQTSVFARLGGSYQTDPVGYSLRISDSLIQRVYMMNTTAASGVNGNVDFSTPLRFIGLNVQLAVNASWNSGQTFVNDQKNLYTSLSRSFSLSFDNRKKEQWELDFGAEITLTNASYSIQESLNNRYQSLSCFADLSYTPSDAWYFGVSANLTNYSAESFDGAVNIPLLGAEAGFNFLSNRRAQVAIKAYDILDKNKGIERVAEMNYLRETRSNVMGRYVMLSFKYRLNKAAKAGGGFEIKVKNR